MTRTPIGTMVATVETTTVNYPVWLTKGQLESVRRAFEASDDDWGDWSANAFARLMREDEAELRSLLKGLGRTGRADKVALPCRIRTSVLDQVRQASKKYKCTVQAVLSTAFSMHALAPTLVVDNQGQSL
jgi:hypothetical protein